MKTREKLSKAFGILVEPLRRNALLFVSLYVLGILSAVLTKPHWASSKLYANLWIELFLDLYVLCAFLSLLPQKVRRWVRGCSYVVAYAVTLADTYCFWKFDSTINPSMLMLLAETNSREAGEMMSNIITADFLSSEVMWIVGWGILTAVAAMLWHRAGEWLKRWQTPVARWSERLHARLMAGLCTFLLVVLSLYSSWANKAGIVRLLATATPAQAEYELTQPDHGTLYQPLLRLWFSVHVNNLAAGQVDQLIAAADEVQVDSCTHRSPTIVLIVGESYAKHHSQLYGYPMATTPRQVERAERGLLTPFTDVVATWNLTSFVFKSFLSMQTVGQPGEWCDYALFPELFRKAGYHVTFLTDQFLSKAKEEVYDFSGGFFLNNPVLSAKLFDARNDRLHRFDSGLLTDYDSLLAAHVIPDSNRLVIFHLLGQHLDYNKRYPTDRRHFWASDYEKSRPELTDKQRKMISHYDNATLYNDSVVDAICKRFEGEEAIVIYFSDHGEEIYEGNRGIVCRNHAATVDYDLAHYEFEVPFWIYVTPLYAQRHPDIVREVHEAKDKPFMTDALPHLLTYLAGIYSKDSHDQYNVLSSRYDVKRKRTLKNTVDYNKLKADHEYRK